MNGSRIEQLKAFLEQSPNDSFLKFALALEYVNSKNDSYAEELFQDLLTNDPNYTATYYHYGKFLESQQRFEEALSIYSQGISRIKEQDIPASNLHLRELQEAHRNLEIDLEI